MTAEFMLLLPALTLIVSLAIASFSFGLSKIQLEVEAFQRARLYAITGDSAGHLITQDGRFHCLEVSQGGLFQIQAKACVLRYGG